MPDADTALRVFEGVVPWLPTLLALSANSPFAEGRATGLRSTRADRLLLLPTGGTPPPLPDWPAWEAATAGDETRRHWDAWPRPEHGTLEVRVMDQQTDVVRSAGFAAIVQALAIAVADRASPPYDRALYARRRADATRLPPDPAEVAALAELIEPGELAALVLDGRPEAERQLELGPGGGARGASIPVVTTETIQVSGIRCERCVNRLAAALTGHEGLDAANANLMGQVTLTWDEEQTSREDLLAAMAKAGFREVPAGV